MVGAGILGLSTAYHIKLANPALKVLVVDKNVAAGLGSTVNSAAAFRCFFSSSSNLALADSSVEFYKHLQQDLGVDLKMRWCGYLWMFTEDEYLELFPVLKDLEIRGFSNQEYVPERLAETLGMRVDFAGDEEAQRLNVQDVYKAVFVPKAGLIGVMQLVHFYESEFLKVRRRNSLQHRSHKAACGDARAAGSAWRALLLAESVHRWCGNAIGHDQGRKDGGSYGSLASSAFRRVGIECHVKARKRQVFSVKAETDALRKLLRAEEFSSLRKLTIHDFAQASRLHSPKP